MKQKIAVITDSTSDLPQALVEQYDIEVLPLRIVYKDKEYRDNVDITADEVYEGLEREVPTTSLPLPVDVMATFEKLRTEGFTHVVSLHLSSGLSGTSQMIRQMTDDIKDMVVRVVDSKSISMGLGVQALEAARAVQKQASFEAVCQHIEDVRKNSTVIFVLDTLEYLKKGGRIGKVAGTLGQILNVKPIIYVNDNGVYETHSKVRGRRQSIDRMFEIAREKLTGPSQVTVCHGGAPNEAQALLERLKGLENVKDIMTCHVSPVIGVHTGPGTIGVIVYSPGS